MKNTFKIIAVFLVLLIGFYIFFQVYSIANPSYKTEVATLYQVTDSISCQGVIFRDETVVSISEQGIIEYTAENGDKVAQGSIIAKVHYSQDAAKSDLVRSMLADRQEMYRSFSESGDIVSTNFTSLSTNLYRNVRELAESVDRFSGVSNAYNKAVGSLYNFMAASGNVYSFDSAISELDERRNEYSTQYATNVSFIHAPSSGYFCNTTDGYEDKATKEYASEITVEEFAQMLETRQEQSVYGQCKLITNYNWYYVAMITSSEAERFYKGMRLNLSFDDSSAGALPVTVLRVEKSDDGRAIVVLSCNNLNSDIADLRFENGKISFNDYKGIRVDRSALHVSDGEVGVYIKYGTTVMFRKLDIIYETDSYVVSRINTSDSTRLRLYDEIITEGKDLYVGKDLSR